uniref:Protein O-glucosyltransferase 3 n=1 Tax=Oncorhynchus kisutch TaxID=8019 RepID=A0A8C7N9R3_ONCKI
MTLKYNLLNSILSVFPLVCIVLILFTCNFQFCQASEVRPEKCLVWGPGLDPKVVLPVRSRLSTQLGKTSLRVSVYDNINICRLVQKQHVRIHTHLPLDRGDGSFLMRYCLHWQILDKRQSVISIDINERARTDIVNINIFSDFSVFPSIDLQRLLQEVPCRFSNRGGLIHYAVIDNQVAVRLPDVEFYINVGDRPMETRKQMTFLGLFQSSPGAVPQTPSSPPMTTLTPPWRPSDISSDLLSVQGNTEQALFCGRDSREECLHLVNLSKKRGRDLGKTNLVGFFDLFKVGEHSEHSTQSQQLMLGSSLVLKQNSPNHFYTHLKKPGTHCIPIEWAMVFDTSDSKAGQTIVRQLVQPNRFYCYYYSVLQMFSERQTNQPTLHPDMKRVPQPSDQSALYSCQQEPQRDDPSLEKDEL